MNHQGQLELSKTCHIGFCSESETAAVPNLSYIWSVTGIEAGQVIMVLKQEGENLYGQAKYEPDSGQSWNGVVIGFSRRKQSRPGTELSERHRRDGYPSVGQFRRNRPSRSKATS